MKKNYLLLVLLISCAGVVFGQSTKKPDLKNVHKNVQVQSTNVNETVLLDKAEQATFEVQAASLGSFENFKFSKNSNAPAALEAEYRRPYGSMVRTAVLENNGGLAKYNNPLLVVPARQTLPFEPYASESANFTWSIMNTEIGAETDLGELVDGNGVLNYHFDLVVPQGYSAFIPKLKATVGSSSATYTYGQEVAEGASFQVSPNNIIDPIYNYTLTDCDMHLGGGPYSGFQSGESFGSNYGIDGIPAEAIMSYYEAPLGVFSFNSLDVLATNTAGTGDVIPAGKSLYLSIHYVTNGIIEEEPVAEAVATADDVKVVGWVGFINFKFADVDEDGFETDKIVHLQDKPYVVLVSGFDSTFDIDFLFSSAHGWAGGAFTINSGYVKTLGYSNLPDTPMCNYAIAFHGVFNCFEIELETNYLEIPQNGGYAANAADEVGSVVYSTFGIDELDLVEISDWLTLEYDDTYFENYNILYFFAKSDPLPANVTGRVGKVVLGSFGRTVTIYVKQGDAQFVGISSVKTEETKAVRQGDNFLLSYPAGATSVSVYNIAGQRIGEYKLNASGTYTLPAGNLAKGVYVLKFNGEKAASVKILK